MTEFSCCYPIISHTTGKKTKNTVSFTGILTSLTHLSALIFLSNSQYESKKVFFPKVWNDSFN